MISKFKLLDNIELYNYHNTWVTKEHIVYLENKGIWIRINDIKDKLLLKNQVLNS